MTVLRSTQQIAADLEAWATTHEYGQVTAAEFLLREAAEALRRERRTREHGWKALAECDKELQRAESACREVIAALQEALEMIGGCIVDPPCGNCSYCRPLAVLAAARKGTGDG